MSRLYSYDPVRNYYNSPSTYYETVVNNPKAKPRLKKKAQAIIDNWKQLPVYGDMLRDICLSENPSFFEWMKIRKELRRTNYGHPIRYTFRNGMKIGFQDSIAFYEMMES